MSSPQFSRKQLKQISSHSPRYTYVRTLQREYKDSKNPYKSRVGQIRYANALGFIWTPHVENLFFLEKMQWGAGKSVRGCKPLRAD